MVICMHVRLWLAEDSGDTRSETTTGRSLLRTKAYEVARHVSILCRFVSCRAPCNLAALLWFGARVYMSTTAHIKRKDDGVVWRDMFLLAKELSLHAHDNRNRLQQAHNRIRHSRTSTPTPRQDGMSHSVHLHDLYERPCSLKHLTRRAQAAASRSGTRLQREAT